MRNVGLVLIITEVRDSWVGRFERQTSAAGYCRQAGMGENEVLSSDPNCVYGPDVQCRGSTLMLTSPESRFQPDPIYAGAIGNEPVCISTRGLRVGCLGMDRTLPVLDAQESRSLQEQIKGRYHGRTRPLGTKISEISGRCRRSSQAGANSEGHHSQFGRDTVGHTHLPVGCFQIRRIRDTLCHDHRGTPYCLRAVWYVLCPLPP